MVLQKTTGGQRQIRTKNGGLWLLIYTRKGASPPDKAWQHWHLRGDWFVPRKNLIDVKFNHFIRASCNCGEIAAKQVEKPRT